MTYPVPYKTKRENVVETVIGFGVMIGMVVFMLWWNSREPSESAPDPTPRFEGYTTVAAEHGIYLLVPEEIQLEEPEEPDYRP